MPNERFCPVFVGTRKRHMRCLLPAHDPREQDGEWYFVCGFHVRYERSLPFTVRALPFYAGRKLVSGR